MFLGTDFLISTLQFSSVQFSHSVVSDSLQSHGLQHASPPCQSLTPGVYSNSCPLSRWCYPTISSSVFPFSLAFNLSQHQGLFKWVSSSHQVVKVLELSFSISPSNEYSGPSSLSTLKECDSGQISLGLQKVRSWKSKIWDNTKGPLESIMSN